VVRATTTKITGGTAIIAVTAYSDATADEVQALQAQWSQALVAAGHPDAGGWRYQPLQLRALDGALALPPGDLDGTVTVARTSDAGTVTFSVGLTATGAVEWNDRLNEGRGSLVPGMCTLTASYVAQTANLIDVGNHTLTAPLGTLLADATSSVISVVNPETTVATRVIVTAHDLVDAATVDLVPSEGASATSFMFTKDGGQTALPITAEHIDNVTVAYTATVRYTPPQWPVIIQKGVLDFAAADWTIWVKPDAWLLEYDVVTMLIDDKNHVIAPGAETGSDVITVRLDYSHPALPTPLSLTFQTESQQLVKVPFPNPPGTAGASSLTLTVMGIRGGSPAGPFTRTLAPDENMIVVKAYVNGTITATTNKDAVVEGNSPEHTALRVMAETGRAEDSGSAGPAVLAISPSNGPEAGGTLVTISGRGYSEVSSVSFGDVQSPNVDTTDDATITAEAPAGTGTVHVRVTTPAGTSDDGDEDQFSYEAVPEPAGDVPAVTGVDPSHGPEDGGTAVTISGSSFGDVSSVEFGGTGAASYTVDDDHTIRAEAPAGSGVVGVTVTTAAGSSPSGAGDQFTYDAPDQPVPDIPRPGGAGAPGGPPFANAADITAFFASKTGQSFPAWFNATQANQGPWAGRAMKTDADTAAAFTAVWDRIPLMFGRAQISLDQFLALQSIFINELGGGMKPVSELFGSPGHSGIAYLFDAIPGIKSSYNGGGASRTAFDLFNDPDFLAAHASLAFGDALAHTTDAVWAGTVYPQNRYPTNASAAGIIFEADFAKFRGRGLIQTTWRSGYKRLIEWVQAYTGDDPTVISYSTRWRGSSSDTIASQSTNAGWDELFGSSNFEIACAAVNLHNTASGNYLDLSTDEAVLLGNGAGSFARMGQRISGSGAYGAKFKDRVVRMRTALT
jgi:hypothetical protein